jgi:hypothetical protein
MYLYIEVKMTPSLATERFEMELTVQMNTLIQDAPDDRTTSQGISTIAPLLVKLARSRLNHAYYYVVQDRTGALLRTIYAHSTQSLVEKAVIFAFPTAEDALEETLTVGDRLDNTDSLTLKIPVLELLFRFWALNWCDALVFWETPGDRSQGVEITHASLTQLIQTELATSKKRSGGKGFGRVC